MFGYIKPYKPELKVIEFDTYKAVYCGLCKQLGKVYGPFARLTLSYDFAFLSMLSLGVAKECPGFRRESCAANPLKKKPCLLACDDSRFAASAAMVMLYYKIRDNYDDGGLLQKLGATLLLPWANRARKKASKLYPRMDQVIGREMEKQRELEARDDTTVDGAAEPSARALAEIAGMIPAEENDSRVLYRLGYLVGRWVYLVDALDDLEEDLKRGGFNPYLKKFGLSKESGTGLDLTEVKSYAVGAIHLTAGELSNTYELLTLKRYKPILDNIIYLGLKDTLDKVIKGETKKKQKQKDMIHEK